MEQTLLELLAAICNKELIGNKTDNIPNMKH